MEADNVLADQMQVCRPVFPVLLCTVSFAVITNTGNVIGQRIQPYIYNMFVVKVYRYPPCKGTSGYTQILQAREKEIVHHLIFTGYRLYKFRMGIDMFNQSIRIFAHLKEIGFLFGRFHFSAAIRAFSVHKLGFCPERLTGCAVKPLISAFVNISLFIQTTEYFLYLLLMCLVCSPDKFII